jgi:hypothetical protein
MLQAPPFLEMGLRDCYSTFRIPQSLPLMYLSPTIGMGNGFCFTGCDAGCRLRSSRWPARSAGISDLLTFLVLDESDGFFPEDIHLIGADFQRLGRADFHTPTASSTSIGVDDDIPFPRTVFITVIGNHLFSVRGRSLEAVGKFFLTSNLIPLTFGLI